MKKIDISYTYQGKHVDASRYITDDVLPKLLFLHGAGDAYQMYENLYKELSKYYQIFGFNFPGVGYSKGKIITSYKEIVTYIDNFLEYCEMQPNEYTLVGNSLGCTKGLIHQTLSKTKANRCIYFSPAIYLKNTTVPKLIINSLQSKLHTERHYHKDSVRIINKKLKVVEPFKRVRIAKQTFTLVEFAKQLDLSTHAPSKILFASTDLQIDLQKNREFFNSIENFQMINVPFDGHGLLRILSAKQICDFIYLS